MKNPKIFLSPPDVGEAEKIHVAEALESGWVAPVGSKLDEFENLVSRNAGRSFGVGLSSGTSALHLGLIALGVCRGDYVICSTLTFVASANVILYLGAIPIFVDSDGETGNMSPDLLKIAIEESRARGQKIAAVIVVDFLGSVARYEELEPLLKQHGIPLLADAAEALGASRGNRPAGNFGDAAVFSFNGNKIATTSAGGVFVTDDSKIAERVRFLSSQAREPALHYEHSELGYNYRLSNLLAAVGVAQMMRLEEFVARRRQNRANYRALFGDLPGARVLGVADSEDNCWLTAVVVDPAVVGFEPEEMSRSLAENGIESRPLWKPMHLQPLYQAAEAYVDGTAEQLFLQGVALPSGSNLSRSQWDRIEGTIRSFFDAHQR